MWGNELIICNWIELQATKWWLILSSLLFLLGSILCKEELSTVSLCHSIFPVIICFFFSITIDACFLCIQYIIIHYYHSVWSSIMPNMDCFSCFLKAFDVTTFGVFSCSLLQQDVPGSICTFLWPDMKSVIFPKSTDSF